MEKEGSGRTVKMKLFGENDKKVIWQNSRQFKNAEKTWFFIGFSQSIAENIRVIYLDDQNNSEFKEISPSFKFDFSPQHINLFGNSLEEDQATGHVNLSRFLIMNSGSPVIEHIAMTNKEDDCKIESSYYEDEVCLICNDDKIVNLERKCLEYCPYGQKNGMTDVCVKCQDEFCDELNSTRFELVNNNDKNNEWHIKSSRPVKAESIDAEKVFNIAFTGEKNSMNDFNYKLEPSKDPDYTHRVFFDWKDNFKEENLTLTTNFDDDKPIYDVNHNLIYMKNTETELKRACYVSDDKDDKMKILAYFLLWFYVFTAVFLLIFTIFCCRKRVTIAGLWKYMLHMWMKLQMVAFFIFINVYMSCCLRRFLHYLYKYGVSWDHELRELFDNWWDDEHDYVEGLNEFYLTSFISEDVQRFILHNMGIFFLVHIVIFIVYILIKLCECIGRSLPNSCIYQINNFLEYYGLIFGYLLVSMQIFVFATLNLRRGVEDPNDEGEVKMEHGYFIVCLIVAILYLLVLILFWIYAAVRLLGNQIFFMNKLNYNKFYYFFAGFKKNKSAQTYDLWMILAHFIVGCMIGILYDHSLSAVIVILVTLIILFAITLILRPWKSNLLLFGDIISQIGILVLAFMFFLYQVWDSSDCEECGSRESVLCWLIVIFVFAALLLGLICLIIQTLINTCSKP